MLRRAIPLLAAALIGLGNLGRALLSYGGFAAKGMNLVAAFDADPSKVGQTIGGHPVLAMEKLADALHQHDCRLAILDLRAAAVGVDAPSIAGIVPPGIDGDHDALGAEDLRTFGDQLRAGDGGGVQGDLVSPGLKHLADIFNRANAAADGERNEDLIGGALHDVDHRLAAVRAGGDIEKDELIGALGPWAASLATR